MDRDENYFKMCQVVGENSKCFSRKLGAILVRDKTVIATGYNGPPRGVPHCDVRCLKDKSLQTELKKFWKKIDNFEGNCPRQLLEYKSGQGLHLCIAGHAERNCIVNAARMGVCVKDSTLYLNTNIPCKDCLIEIINAGINEIVCTNLDYYDEQSKFLIENSKIKIRTFNKIGE